MQSVEQKLRNYILSELLNATTENDFIKLGQNNFTVGGETLTAAQSTDIIEEANQLKKNKLFNSLLRELEYDAQNRIFNKSIDFTGVDAPKWLLYAVDLIRKKVEAVSKLQVKKIKKDANGSLPKN